eukprot:g70321.t1
MLANYIAFVCLLLREGDISRVGHAAYTLGLYRPVCVLLMLVAVLVMNECGCGRGDAACVWRARHSANFELASPHLGARDTQLNLKLSRNQLYFFILSLLLVMHPFPHLSFACSPLSSMLSCSSRSDVFEFEFALPYHIALPYLYVSYGCPILGDFCKIIVDHSPILKLTPEKLTNHLGLPSRGGTEFVVVLQMSGLLCIPSVVVPAPNRPNSVASVYVILSLDGTNTSPA